jgi:hypothetical protein
LLFRDASLLQVLFQVDPGNAQQSSDVVGGQRLGADEFAQGVGRNSQFSGCFGGC